jgi:hypothetical protein
MTNRSIPVLTVILLFSAVIGFVSAPLGNCAAARDFGRGGHIGFAPHPGFFPNRGFFPDRRFVDRRFFFRGRFIAAPFFAPPYPYPYYYPYPYPYPYPGYPY